MYVPKFFMEQELRAIVGFRMPITRLVTKFKLGQNRTAEDRAGALHGLQCEGDPGSAELAAFAREYLKRQAEETK